MRHHFIIHLFVNEESDTQGGGKAGAYSVMCSVSFWGLSLISCRLNPLVSHMLLVSFCSASHFIVFFKDDFQRKVNQIIINRLGD